MIVVPQCHEAVIRRSSILGNNCGVTGGTTSTVRVGSNPASYVRIQRREGCSRKGKLLMRCCQKSLFREKAKFCAECGKQLHRSLAVKEEMFFQISAFFDPGKAMEVVEDIDRYGDMALDWHGLVKTGRLLI